MGNKIVHWELMAADGEKLAAFYRDIFGWNSQPTPGFDGYNMVSAEDAGVGGAVGTGDESMPNYLTIYVEVESVDDHLAKIEAGGGRTLVPRTALPGIVTFGLFADPAGNMVGLVEAEIPPAE